MSNVGLPTGAYCSLQPSNNLPNASPSQRSLLYLCFPLSHFCSSWKFLCNVSPAVGVPQLLNTLLFGLVLIVICLSNLNISRDRRLKVGKCGHEAAMVLKPEGTSYVATALFYLSKCLCLQLQGPPL